MTQINKLLLAGKVNTDFGQERAENGQDNYISP